MTGPKQHTQPYGFVSYCRPNLDDGTIIAKSSAHFAHVATRRSVRHFSPRPIPKAAIEKIILAAATAPSGAHKQPWTFCAISDPSLKTQIRQAAEQEEKRNYEGRMPESWLKDLEPFDTNWEKPMLEIAPWLIVVFRQTFTFDEREAKKKNYYVTESVGIATGFLLAAIHEAGLVALTHTPSPMNFLERMLKRPANEKAFLLIPVGHPDPNAMVPDLVRKPAAEVIQWY